MEFVTSFVVSTSLYDDFVPAYSPSLSCVDSDLIANITAKVNDFNVVPDDDYSTMSDSERCQMAVKYVVNKIVAPLICAFGIVGNLLNLVVLTRKRLQCTMDRMEKSSHVGMVALALSDFMFCLFYLLTLVVPDKTVSPLFHMLMTTVWLMKFGDVLMALCILASLQPLPRQFGLYIS